VARLLSCASVAPLGTMRS